MRGWLAVAGIAGAIGAAMGAAAAHLVGDNPAAAFLISTAQQYQLWHALALALVATLGWNGGAKVLRLSAWAFLLGILLFCGALYLGAFTGRSFGPMAPAGGILLILGWVALAVHGWIAMRDQQAAARD